MRMRVLEFKLFLMLLSSSIFADVLEEISGNCSLLVTNCLLFFFWAFRWIGRLRTVVEHFVKLMICRFDPKTHVCISSAFA